MNQVLCFHIVTGCLSARTRQSVCSFVGMYECVPYSRTGTRGGEIENGRNTQDRVRVGVWGGGGELTLSWEVTGTSFSTWDAD